MLLPSALRRALPQFGNEAVFMLHGSAVASVITLQDILGAGRTLNAKFYLAYEGFLTAAVLYMAITFLLVLAFRALERRYLRHLARALKGRSVRNGGNSRVNSVYVMSEHEVAFEIVYDASEGTVVTARIAIAGASIELVGELGERGRTLLVTGVRRRRAEARPGS